jgi:hypothetical protein
MESRHVHGVGVDSRSDIYAGIDPGTQRRQVRANRLSADVSFVRAGGPIMTGTTFIFVGDPYCVDQRGIASFAGHEISRFPEQDQFTKHFRARSELGVEGNPSPPAMPG